MRKAWIFGMGVIVGIVAVLTIPLMLAQRQDSINDNDNSILARLKRLEDKLKYYEERLTVTEVGKVGIGTDQPERALHIQRDCADMVLRSTKARNPAWLYFSNDFDHNVAAAIGTGGSEYLDNGGPKSFNILLKKPNGEYFYVLIAKPDGKVGIGTVTPEAIFHIQQSLAGERGVVIRQGVSTGTGDNLFRVEDAKRQYRVRIDQYFDLYMTDSTGGDSVKISNNGEVRAKKIIPGDIVFEKDGKKLWRMFEDENGLYLENTITGKVYTFVLQEVPK